MRIRFLDRADQLITEFNPSPYADSESKPLTKRFKIGENEEIIGIYGAKNHPNQPFNKWIHSFGFILKVSNLY